MNPDNVAKLPSEEIRGLQDQITALRTQLEDRDLELMTTKALLRAQSDGSADEPPPPELVHAIRSWSPQRHQPVWVTVGASPMLVLVDGAARAADPAAEAAVWRRLRNLHKSA